VTAPKVNLERVQLLVDALRSGRFEQGTRQLLKGDEHCCLGVACVAAQEHGLVLQREVDDLDGKVTFGDPHNWLEDYDDSQLPKIVMRWYGFESIDPELLGDGTDEDPIHVQVDGSLPASSWNDDYERDFNWIADAFERTFITPNTGGSVDAERNEGE
jgi:hypothetical protein